MSGEASRIVRRGTILFWLVVASALLLLFELVSGVILWFVLPAGQGARSSSSAEVWSLGRHTWIDLHNWAALMLVAVVIVHVAMHWKWVVRRLRGYVTGNHTASNERKAPEVTGETA